MNKSTFISIIISLFIIGLTFLFISKPESDISDITNIQIIDGVQIIELEAKGGYSPRRNVAQAGLPTIIRFKTTSTFDCSLSLRIPSINHSQILPQTGQTDVSIGTSTLGIFRGSCSMGMYPFEIDFQ